MFLKLCKYLLFLLGVLFLDMGGVSGRNVNVVKEYANETCVEKGRAIYETNGGDWCCACPIGHYKNLDCNHGDPATTTCMTCPFDSLDSNKQTFMDTENNRTECYQAQNESYCDNFMNTHFVPGSTITNSRCACPNGYYNYGSGCHKHSPCSPGFQPSVLGTENSNTECEKCSPNTFSNIPSATARCIPFNLCLPGEIKIREGNSKKDVECGPDPRMVTNTVTTQTAYSQNHSTVPNIFNMTSQNVTPIAIEDNSITHIVVPVVVVILMVICVGVFIKCCCRKNNAKKIKLDTKTNGIHESKDVHENLMNGEGKDERKGDYVVLPERSTMKTVHETTSFIALTSETMKGERHAEHVGEQNKCSPPDVKSNQENGIKTNMATIVEEEHPDQKAVPFPSNYVELFSEEELRNASERNVRDCCIEGCLKDHKIGKSMIQTLTEHIAQDVRTYIRQYLSELEIQDTVDDNPLNVNEQRQQWINLIVRKKGKLLTPKFIFETQFEFNAMKENMTKVFWENVTVCHGV